MKFILLMLFLNANAADFSIFNFKLGITKMDEIKNQFQSKDFIKDEKTSISILCYIGPGQSTISFISDENLTLNEIVVNSSSDKAAWHKQCEKNKNMKSKFVINKVSLGMSPLLIKTVIGKPLTENSNQLIYDNNFEINLKQDMVTSLKIRK